MRRGVSLFTPSTFSERSLGPRQDYRLRSAAYGRGYTGCWMWVSENFSFLGTWVNKGKEKGRSPTLDPGQWLTRGFSYTRVMPTVLRIDTEDAHHDEGNAYVRLGDVLSRSVAKMRLGTSARRVSSKRRGTITAGWPRLCGSRLSNWASRLTELVLRVRSKTGMWGIIKKVKVCSVASKKDALGRRETERASPRAAKGFL